MSSSLNNLIVETGEAIFSNNSSVTITLTGGHFRTPTISLVATDGNFNTFISSVSTSSFTIETSDNFSGKVHYHAMSNGA